MFSTASQFENLRHGQTRRPNLLARIFAGRRMRRELQAMRELDDYLLDDIGLDRHAAERLAREANPLPKWDAPAHWRC